MANFDVESVNIYRKHVDRLLERAESVKPNKQIEPPLTETQLGDSLWAVQGEEEQVVKDMVQQTQFAAVEIAFRERFYNVLVRAPSNHYIMANPVVEGDNVHRRSCFYPDMEFVGYNLNIFRQWWVC